MKGLLIEDDKSIASSMKVFLKEKNILLDHELDGRPGLISAEARNYDFILLDYNLPSLNGLEFTKALRAKKIGTPIIMVTVRSELEDKLELFKLGVDDYVVKPFSLCELYARIKAITRRPKQIAPNFLKVKDITLYPDKFLVKKKNKSIRLRAKEFALLEFLMKNAGCYQSRQEILENVWDQNADAFSNSIEVHIMKLRRAISDKNNKYIYTLANCGYKIDSHE